MKSNLSILIIDDNIADSTLLRRLFNRLPNWDVTLEMASSGEEGIALAKVSNPDIIFVDYLLGEMTGIELITILQNNGCDASFVLLTGFGSEFVVTEALRVGAHDYIHKSELTIDSLDRTLRLQVNKIMTDRKLKKTEQMLGYLIENTDTGLVVLNNNGIIVDVNNNFVGFIHQENKEELIGKDIRNWLAVDNITKIDEIIRKCKQGEINSDFEMKFTTTSGDNIFVSISAVYEKKFYDENIVALCRNITSQKQYEEQLRCAKEAAEQADKLKSDFLANMSHEIRTPMNAIVGFTSFLSDPELDFERRKEFCSLIHDSSDKLLNLINDIIDIAVIESGQLKLRYEAVNLSELMLDIEKKIKVRVKNTKPGLLSVNLIKYGLDDNLIIATDKARLTQILKNLLDNAIKFTDSGVIEFGCRALNTESLIFHVKDSGIGITPENEKLIFEKFRKGKNNNKEKLYGGTGLGLPISKKLVEMLNGEIWFESKPNQGTVFYFTMPQKREMLNGLGLQTSIRIDKIPDLQNISILIAEDERDNYILISEILKQTGVKISWAKNGVEAIELCNKNTFDLILMDIKMPDLDGYQTTRYLRKNGFRMPIIAQTAFAQANDEALAIEAGCNDYIIKPIEDEILISKVNKWIKESFNSLVRI